MERDALAVAAEVVGVPVEAVEVEVAADLAVFSELSAARARALRSRAAGQGRGDVLRMLVTL